MRLWWQLVECGQVGITGAGLRGAAVASAGARTASTPITRRSGVGFTPARLIRQGFRPSHSIARALRLARAGQDPEDDLGLHCARRRHGWKRGESHPPAPLVKSAEHSLTSLAGSHHGC